MLEKKPNDVRQELNELSDDELDEVAGGCGGGGNGTGHGHSNGKGHHSHGNGKGKGHDKNGCGCGDDSSEAETASAGITFTCPFCGKTMEVADNIEARVHVGTCPKNPNACL